jgi:TctA family transporter
MDSLESAMPFRARKKCFPNIHLELPAVGGPLGLLFSSDIIFPMWRLLKEFMHYLREEKKWWLYPLVIMLVLLGALLIFGSSSGLGWAIYPFM